MNSYRVSDAELRKFLNNGKPLPEKLSESLIIFIEIVKNLMNQLAAEDTDMSFMVDQTLLCFLFLRHYALSRVPASVGPRSIELTNEFCQTCTYLVGTKLQYDETQSKTLLSQARTQIKEILQLIR